jgi:aspartate carbamoyltransferase regulatory subunit
MGFCKSYCLTPNKCRTRVVSDKDMKKINLYRPEKCISAIHMEECFNVVIDKTGTNYIRNSTVVEILAMAVLNNDSSYKHLDCDNGLGVSNNSTYTLLEMKIAAAFHQ